jgi:hypothetical protein
MPDKGGCASFGRIKKNKREALVDCADKMGIGAGDFIFGLFEEDMSPIGDWVDRSE